MARCEYRHKVFAEYDSSNAYMVDGDGCWVGDTTDFNVKGKAVAYCIFHAPPGALDSDRNWNVRQRGQMQADALGKKRTLLVWKR